MLMFGSNSTTGADKIEAPVFEGYGAEVNGDKIALMEAHDDYVAIFEAMHAMDMVHIQPEAVCESFGGANLETVKENLAKNAFDKIRKFFMNLWGKLKAFFTSAVRLLDAITKDGKAFAEKYQAEIRTLKVDGMEYKMHEYTNLDGGMLVVGAGGNASEVFAEINGLVNKPDTDAALEELTKIVEDMRSDREDALEAARGDVLGKGALTDAEFKAALYAHFRNGADSKKDVDAVKVNLSAILTALKDTKAKKTAEDLQKFVDKEFSAILGELKKVESKLQSAKVKDGAAAPATGGVSAQTAKGNAIHTSEKLVSVAVQLIQMTAGMFSSQQKIQSDAFTAWRSAIDERSRAYKGAVLAAYRYKKKK